MRLKFSNFLLLSIIVLAIVTGCNSKENATTGAKTKEPIRVATNPTFAPASYKDDSGKLIGFEPALMKEIGKRCNRKVEWIEAEGMDTLFGTLDAGKADTIAFQISINKERKENYLFSDIYGTNKILLAVRKDFKYDSLEDLHGKK